MFLYVTYESSQVFDIFGGCVWGGGGRFEHTNKSKRTEIVKPHLFCVTTPKSITDILNDKRQRDFQQKFDVLFYSVTSNCPIVCSRFHQINIHTKVALVNIVNRQAPEHVKPVKVSKENLLLGIH